MMSLPSYMANMAPATFEEKPTIMAKVCEECPWRKENKVGEYHPAAGAAIFNIVEKHVEMACHMSQRGEYLEPGSKAHRCRGIEVFRANIEIDSEVKPDFKTVFANREEALDAWPRPTTDFEAMKQKFFRRYPEGHWVDEKGLSWVAGKRAPEHDAGCSQCGVF